MKRSDIRLDRTQLRIFKSFEEAAEFDLQYWHSRTPEQRRDSLKIMHQFVHGEDAELPIDLTDDRVLDILLNC
jgi:hypothetical protein